MSNYYSRLRSGGYCECICHNLKEGCSDCCNGVKLEQRIAKLEKDMNNEAENCSYMAMDERVSSLEESLNIVITMYKELEIELKRSTLLRGYIMDLQEKVKEFEHVNKETFSQIRTNCSRLLKLECGYRDLVEQVTSLKNHEVIHCEVVSVVEKNIKELEEQVKALQSNFSQSSNPLPLPTPGFDSSGFTEKFAKPVESETIRNDNCPCDCHKINTVGSSALGCMACTSYHFTIIDLRQNKKTKTYWVNVYLSDQNKIFVDDVIYEDYPESFEIGGKYKKYLKSISFELDWYDV